MTTPFPFQSGQTLLAAQLNAITTLPINDETASYTLVVGDVGNRVIMNVASANTVTVNNNVFGVSDQVQIINKGAGTTTITAGAGVTINSASGLTLVQYQSGTLIALSASTFLFVKEDVAVSAGGLVFITGATFSAVSSVSLPNNTFTSTYNNYRVMIFISANSTDETAFTLRMRASGTDDATGYYGAFYGCNAVTDTFRVIRSNNATGFALGTLRTGTVDQGFSFDVLNPQTVNNTTWIGGATGYLAAANDYGAFSFAGAELSATQFDALSFFPAAGTITGTYRVYGYADS